jgi:hypothetical protein
VHGSHQQRIGVPHPHSQNRDRLTSTILSVTGRAGGNKVSFCEEIPFEMNMSPLRHPMKALVLAI